MKKQNRDIYQEVTNKIIEALENNPKQWESGISGLASGMPTRANGELYKGINVLLLWCAAREHGYTGSQWMTYKQAQAVGANVRKGEKGTQVVFFKPLTIKDKDTGEEKEIPMIRYYTVFNVDQIDNLPEKYQVETVAFDWDTIEAGEALKASSACPIKTINDTPHYAPQLDYIGMPEAGKFHNAENYYRVLAHEMAHSTGHKDRLNREGITGERTKTSYAFEELVAELAAVFTCEQLGIDGDLENHASYIQSWLRAMKDDKKFVFKAATKAQKASEFILNRVDTQKQKKAA